MFFKLEQYVTISVLLTGNNYHKKLHYYMTVKLSIKFYDLFVFLYFCIYLLTLRTQNFDSIPHVSPGREAYYGGSVSLADYCPYIQEFIWRSKSVVIRGSHCQYPENNPRKSQ